MIVWTGLENNKLLCLNNDGTYVGSGGIGYIDELPGPVFKGPCNHKAYVGPV